MRGLILASALIGLYFMSQAKTVSEGLIFNLSKVRFKGFTDNFLTTQISVTLNITNPENVPVQIQRVTGTAQVQGLRIADFAVEEPFVIPASGTVNIPINTAIRNRGLIMNLLDLIKEKQVPPVTYQINIGSSLGTFTLNETLQP